MDFWLDCVVVSDCKIGVLDDGLDMLKLEDNEEPGGIFFNLFLERLLKDLPVVMMVICHFDFYIIRVQTN